MLAAGLPSSAVVAGTDMNAVGVMRVLKSAGLVLPRDQAIVGFDDTEAGALITPALSSVRQDFNAIGAKAAQLVLDLASGQEVPALHYRVPTRYIVRSSCGCAPDNLAGTVSDEPIRGGLRHVFLDLLKQPGASEDEAVAARAAEVVADVLEAPEGNLTEELTARLAVVAEELCSRPDVSRSSPRRSRALALSDCSLCRGGPNAETSSAESARSHSPCHGRTRVSRSTNSAGCTNRSATSTTSAWTSCETRRTPKVGCPS